MKRISAWGVLPLAAVAALGAWPTTALAADAAVAVLGVEASDGAPDALATALTDALRQRVSGTKGFRLVAGRDLVEVKLVFSCPDEAPSCMAQAGKSLGAGKLIFGSVKKSIGDNYTVTLKLLDTTRGVVDTWVAEQITKNQAGGTALRGPVQKWFATLTGQGGAGTVRVRGDVIGASVALDGTPYGTIGTEDVTIGGVTPGKHDLTVTKPGYEVVRREVKVASGEMAQVDVTMPRTAGSLPPALLPPPGTTSPKGPVDEATRGEEPASRSALKTATWAVLGAGLVGVGFGVKFGLDVQKINKDLDPYRRFPCTAGMCDAGGVAVRPLNMMETMYVKLKKDDGKRLETYQYISYGVGAALVVAGGYLFYRAYLEDDGERRMAIGPVSFTPLIAPGQTGLAATTTF
jgi:PEGA domain-containing protein